MLSDKNTAVVFVSLAMALVGSGVVASKLIAGGVHPFFAVPLRFTISTPIFVILMYVTRTPRPALSRDELLIVTLQAAAGSAAYSVLMILALTMTTSSNAGVISGLLPILTALVATIALRERLSGRLWVSIVLVTIGALLVSFTPAEGAEANIYQLVGNLLVVVAVVGEALFSILNKKIKRPLAPLYVATLMSAISLALTLPLGAISLLFLPLEITASAAAATVYVSIFPTVLGFWLWYSGSSQLSGSQASVYMAIVPIAALLLSHLFIGENLHISHILGISFVVSGIVYSAAGANTVDSSRPASIARDAD